MGILLEDMQTITNRIEEIESRVDFDYIVTEVTIVGCNGCDGTCNMTCKGGCGSNHSNQGPTNG